MFQELQDTGQQRPLDVSSINGLPTEILTRIFHIARSAEPHSIDCLAIVCSHWRSVTLASHTLWSHIECRPHPSKGFYPGLFVRALLHVSRSGEVPLDFRLSGEADTYNNECEDRPVESLCELVGPRLKSLDLEVSGEDRDDNINSVLSTLLSHCVPEMLTKFVTTDYDRFGFITTSETKRLDNSSLKLGLTGQAMNRIFSSITVLHLIGLFPGWSSRAYHGLVDLRLCASNPEDDDANVISEVQLVKILQASPRLRILHFELRIVGQTGRGVPAPRVRLPELQVLRAESDCRSYSFLQIEHFLRLLEPGQKPLHLCIENNNIPDMKYPCTETKDFFMRSNITKLCTAALPQLSEFLPSLPHLKLLFVAAQRIRSGPLKSSNQDHADPPATYPQLDMLILLRNKATLDGILELTQRCRPRMVSLYDNTITDTRTQQRLDEKMETVKKELSAVCSDVRIPRDCPDWEEHEHVFCD